MTPTPLFRAVDGYVKQGQARFHMPGHKGRPAPEGVPAPAFPPGEMLAYDITEVTGADSLYEASGPIAETEARYTALYGTAGTLLSAGGSTLCIQAMLALGVPAGGKVLCARGVHTAAVNAMALLDLRPEWVYPDADPRTGLALPVTPEQLEAALALHPAAAAVYLTSPDYFGCLCDIRRIAPLCRARGIPLLVDNAHGAHLRFVADAEGKSLHPVAQGADICCDSLHKSLPVLTGGALLHIGNPAYLADARRRMSLFGSTSPSYLIMLSIDCALPYLEGGAREELLQVARRVSALEALAGERGFLLPGAPKDPARLSVGFASLALSREGFGAHLARCGVEAEYLSDSFCVFLAGAHNTREDFHRLRQVIQTAPRGERPPEAGPGPLWATPSRQALTLREAMLSPSEAVPVEAAENRVCAGIIAPCPPGIPLAVAGEVLDKNLCTLLKKCGIFSVSVLK